MRNSRTQLRLLLPTVTILALIVTASGCRLIWPSTTSSIATLQGKPVLAYEISQPELLAHLNANADKIRSWISRDCTMSIRMPNGLPVRLKATIACEEPRNFRLVADGSLVVRADIGSNHDYCWWWMQPGENVLFTVQHEEMDFVRSHPLMKQAMSMPFEPDWLMEVLGVTRLSEAGVTMHRDAHPSRVNLASEHSTGDGRTFRRITVVDLHRGHVVSHRMVDSASNTIARATLSDFQFHDGAQLPGRIEVDWPTMDMSLTITVRNLSVNTELQPNLWQPPTAKSMTHVQLASHLRRIEQAPHQFKKMAMVPERPRDRPVYDENVYGAGGVDDADLPWEDEEPPKRKWFRFPWSKR